MYERNHGGGGCCGKTPLMWNLPTPTNRPPAMAGIADDPRSFAFLGVAAIVAYLLLRRK